MPRSTIHQWEVSGADQKQLSTVRRPSTDCEAAWVARALLDEAVVGGGGMTPVSHSAASLTSPAHSKVTAFADVLVSYV